jgi:hypothetical protein
MVAKRPVDVLERIEELKAILRERFPELETVSWCDSPNQCVIRAYTNAETEYEVLDIVGEKMAEILQEDGVLIAVLPLPMSALYADEAAGA